MIMLWLSLALAQEPKFPTSDVSEEQPQVTELEPDESIVVYGSSDIEVYVGPIEVKVFTNEENIEAVVDDQAAFAYSAQFSHNAKIATGRGSYEPITLNHDKIKVYSEKTIKYAWEDCDYNVDPLACSIYNSHYYIETYVTIDDNELIVKSLMYDADAQVISSGTVRDRKIVKWIKQQEIQQQQTIYNNQSNQAAQRNCSGSSCTSVSVSGSPMNTITTSKPKEEMPLKWVIPHRLLDRHIQQAMKLLWVSVRLEID